MDIINDTIADRLLLDHPFYKRWEEGSLDFAELAPYAEQYRHFEAQLPDFLQTLAERLPEGVAKASVLDNLRDELASPVTHLELFAGFAEAVGATTAQPSAAMAELVALYRDSANSAETSFALGVLAGYEVQAAAIADSKGAGLKRHYGLDGEAIAFWQLHAKLEEDHAAWTLEASQEADQTAFLAGARASAEAWWAFLDERELLAA
ncbi:MAG: iron-containing redox enzyme family protein [Actinomycetota bacterium]